MNDSLRRTGRTTRMLQQAARLATEERQTVVVVGADSRHANQLMEMAGDFIPVRFFLDRIQRRYRIEGAGEIRFLHADHPFIDWETFRPMGMNGDAVILADHHAIESHFARILEMLHRYDPQPEETIVSETTP